MCLTIKAQFDFGGNPPGQNWQYINSEEVRVIYPNGMEAKAQRIANIINYMNINNRRSVGKNRRKFDLVLRNRTTIPNGYVGLAPLRSEFFTTPPQSSLLLGSTDWLDVLSVHEYRHVQQYLNSKVGFTKMAYTLFGEQGWAVLDVFSVPDWYSEGDAVITETSLTDGGRGRAPFFTLEQRALAYADKNYSYLKHRNGSYKSLLPDRYRLGYLMLNKARQVAGNDATSLVLKQSARDAGILWSFSRAMKTHTGMRVTKLYKEAWKDNKNEWAEQLKNTTLIPSKRISKATNTVTDYRFPIAQKDGSIIARKSSYKKTDAIVHIQGDEENVITNVGIGIDDFISQGGDLLAWNEYTNDNRRGNLDYSEIITYNIKTRNKTKLTTKSRYFSPTPSPNGKLIAAINITLNQENNIVILNASNGKIIKELKNPENYFLSRTAWSEDEKYIISIIKKDSKLTLAKFNVNNDSLIMLTPFSSHTIESPRTYKDKVFFNASYSGIDNIFCVNIDGNDQIQQITSVPVGAFDPTISIDGGKVIFSEFSAMGYHLSEQNIGTKPFTYISIEEPVLMPQFDTKAIASEGGNILSKIPNVQYPSANYNGLLRGMKLHSWLVIPSPVTPIISGTMNNILNDVALNVSAGKNINESYSSFYNASINLARYYPVFQLTGSLAERQTPYYEQGEKNDTLKFTESSIGFSVGVPLQWIKGNYYNIFKSKINFETRGRSNIRFKNENFDEDRITAMPIEISIAHLRRTAKQNIGPRGGFELNFNFIKSIGGLKNDKIKSTALVYLPGLLANHYTKISGGFQKELLSNPYQYSDDFFYSRGYSVPINDSYNKISFDYGFPILYPDFGIAGIIYYKRVRGNVFYDYGTATIKSRDETRKFRSYGFELIFDSKYLNLIETSVGLRYSFLQDKDPLWPGRKGEFTAFAALPF